MANILSTVYPPLIDTFMPAFLMEGPAFATFSISPYNTEKSIKRLHVSLVNQKTNLNAFGSSNVALGLNDTSDIKIINGIWILDFKTGNYLSKDSTSELWTLKIPSRLLRGSTANESKNFNIDGYYKLQLRFDDYSGNIENNSDLMNNRANFSEWSSVCLLKAIPSLSIELQGFSQTQDKKPSFNAGIIPISGEVFFDNNTNQETLRFYSVETLRSYSIEIYETEKPENVLDSIDSVFTGDSANPNRIYWIADCENAIEGIDYTVAITIITKNQYKVTKKFDFNIMTYSLVEEFNPVFEFKKLNLKQYETLTVENDRIEELENSEKEIITEEDGDLRFNIKSITESGELSNDIPAGYMYVKRASSLDNYKKWELLSCTFENGTINRDFRDLTVSSLVRYKYRVQYQITKSITPTKSIESKEVIYPNFYTMLLSRKGRQLAIRYNGQITSLRPVVNRQKIDTLGGKYPKFAENAQMNYKQFSISGLIDAESDFNRYFLNDEDYIQQMKDYNEQMNGKYMVRNDTIADGNTAYRARDVDGSLLDGYNNYGDKDLNNWIQETKDNHSVHDIYPFENWWLEREFREQVMEWLNDGEPKLFRSMPEGNMVVMLTDISLTPNRTIGRRLYEFSATMYEIGDGHSLESLNSFGIIDITNDKANSNLENLNQEQSYIFYSTIGQIHSKEFYEGSQSGASLFKGSMYGDPSNVRGWDRQNSTVEEQYEYIFFEENSEQGKNYAPVSSQYAFKDVKINFESKPKWYIIDNNDITLVTGELVDSENKNIQLGYKIGIQQNNDADNEIKIFVNEKGYYQTPTNLEITNLKIYDGGTATVNYKLTYATERNMEKIASSTALARKVVGQISQMWLPGTEIFNLLKQKYRYLYYERGKLTVSEFLNQWSATCLELTPYTYFRAEIDGNTNDYVVGRTGIYNLVDNYPISSLTILGKRMVRTDILRQPFLDDWEYVLDDSALPNEEKDFSKYGLTWNEQGEELVKINDIYFTGLDGNNYVEKISRYWNDPEKKIPELIGYSDISEIKEPKNNTVYGIKTNDGLKYMIYYQDKAWYDVEFETDNNYETIIAKVPVHGMINYWADIIRQEF